jgi:nicotinate phosphoribosyltransferase
MVNKSFFTDRYEFSMVDAALGDGTAQRPAVFSVFTRSLPKVWVNSEPNFDVDEVGFQRSDSQRVARKYGVVGGTYRLLELLKDFRIDDEQLKYLSDHKIVSRECLEFLKQLDFKVDIDGYYEGDLFFPYSPVLNVKGTFAQCTLLETLILSVLNYDSAVASAGARMVSAAENFGQFNSPRTLFDMGARRVHEDAALAAGRIAGVLGFAGTSNLEVARIWGLPPIGTAAHSFILAYPSERDAFGAQIRSLGTGSTFLVDTFDIPAAIRTLCELTHCQAGSIRIDSGNLFTEAERARALLDSLGARNTQITISGDLDEYKIAKLVQAPVDNFGVGTRFSTGSGAPTCNFVYKITEIARSGSDQLIPVGKQSWHKATPPGHRVALRPVDLSSISETEPEQFERYVHASDPLPPDFSPVNFPLVDRGQVPSDLTGPQAVERARAHFNITRGGFPPALFTL